MPSFHWRRTQLSMPGEGYCLCFAQHVHPASALDMDGAISAEPTEEPARAATG